MERKEHMADEILMEEMENEAPLITLEDEEGNEMEFEFLDIVEYEGEEYIVVKYIQKSDRAGYVKLVSQNPHHADKEIEVSRIRAIALVKASIRMNSIR